MKKPAWMSDTNENSTKPLVFLRIRMMWLLKRNLVLCFLGGLLLSGCYRNTSSTDGSEGPDTSQVVVKKPNIYIYPEVVTNISVKLDFPDGGSIIESKPSYNDGWDVTVEPSGTINAYYRYLFYECQVPNIFQYKKGWIVEGPNLSSFFSENLHAFGFSQPEIDDFIDFWIPLFETTHAYLIYPQYGYDLASVIELSISPEPDNLLRLVYVIRINTTEVKNLQEPLIPTFQRQGYFIAEWGVIYE